MFKRVIYEDWQTLVPIIAFVLTFSVFLIQVLRALLIKRPHAERLASLPLGEEIIHQQQQQQSPDQISTAPAPRNETC